MAIIEKIFLTFLLFTTTFLSASSRKSSSTNIDWWCSRTPHPGPCKYYMDQSHRRYRPKHRSEFRGMLVHLALEQALAMNKHVHGYGEECVTKNQRSVFADCLKLYDNTIFHLNRTLHGIGRKKRCSSFDAQTWLSTALTNIETCRNGASDLNVSDFVPHTTWYNVSEIISNSLAINAAFLKPQEENYSREDGFPSWFSGRERKLLQSSNVKAHLVVAKDGSGHFRTVQAAIDAAARRRIKSRFIIRVKRGIYKENIEVDKTNDNIMLIGDGSRYTIITSSRSTQDGFTTYSSATAGKKFHPLPFSVTLLETQNLIFN